MKSASLTLSRHSLSGWDDDDDEDDDDDDDDGSGVKFSGVV